MTRIKDTPTTRPTNCGRCVGRVPMDAGVFAWAANAPASASAKRIGRNLPNIIANPRAVLYHVVFTAIPANAEPLLLAAEVNA